MTETTETAPVNRIERRKQEFRDKITRAAIKLFEKNGIAETSVASIIKEADIAHKTFFNHFPTKDHLLQHVTSSFSNNAYETFRQGLKKQSDPSKRLSYCLISVAKALEGVKPHYKELLNYYLISGKGSTALQQAQREQFTAVIAELIRDANANNQMISRSSEETCTEITVGVCVSILLNWSIEEDYPITAKMKDACRFLSQSLFKP